MASEHLSACSTTVEVPSVKADRAIIGDLARQARLSTLLAGPITLRDVLSCPLAGSWSRLERDPPPRRVRHSGPEVEQASLPSGSQVVFVEATRCCRRDTTRHCQWKEHRTSVRLVIS